MIRMIQIGLGPLGQKLVRFALERKNFQLVEVVDSDRNKYGRDVGEVCGFDKESGTLVHPDIETAARRHKADVAVLATVSSIDRLAPQVEQCAVAGVNVVSTCEELVYPWTAHPETARRIDRACRRYGVACVGTGVNPGYLMDYLPSTFSTLCQRVDQVEVQRVQDASRRRGTFQKKIGAGLGRSAFDEQVKDGLVRHAGLPESIHMIAAAMGWPLDDVIESIEPVIAERRVETDHVHVKPGDAAGIEQVGLGKMNGREVIRLVLRAAVDEPVSYDTVKLTGEPNIESTIAGGVNGDIATCAVTLNVAQVIAQASPGLHTMLDLPGVHYHATAAPSIQM